MSPTRRGRGRLPRVEGIFASDIQVFRFFADGTVLDVLVKPAPGPDQAAAIEGWLRPGTAQRGVHRSTYAVSGGRLSFTTRSHVNEARITVQGVWRGGQLVLDLTGGGRVEKARRFQRIDVGRSLR
ncbi:hypothetical protein FH609_020120 [Streptomyces sp. 3MP-14]|uniref:Uncharacterized protein n=1 Tax=Streptomyces mimosae TaxID=2586635 RepID=A0A5N5ZZZ0_9ACTN|nr:MULTISPECIES: hypothetical protein [Streptomyces]KAB8161835.1 hypothetical protein FH607_024300 [Streptomyces mimosae]KAB8174897.1 hypothetical protein FH609_020120 [Streptomyces sp. 3MP-14]